MKELFQNSIFKLVKINLNWEWTVDVLPNSVTPTPNLITPWGNGGTEYDNPYTELHNTKANF